MISFLHAEAVMYKGKNAELGAWNLGSYYLLKPK